MEPVIGMVFEDEDKQKWYIYDIQKTRDTFVVMEIQLTYCGRQINEGKNYFEAREDYKVIYKPEGGKIHG